MSWVGLAQHGCDGLCPWQASYWPGVMLSSATFGYGTHDSNESG